MNVAVVKSYVAIIAFASVRVVDSYHFGMDPDPKFSYGSIQKKVQYQENLKKLVKMLISHALCISHFSINNHLN